jgi:hypothetical protein
MNEPFAGSIEPEKFSQSNNLVWSLIIEVSRDIYINEILEDKFQLCPSSFGRVIISRGKRINRVDKTNKGDCIISKISKIYNNYTLNVIIWEFGRGKRYAILSILLPSNLF